MRTWLLWLVAAGCVDSGDGTDVTTTDTMQDDTAETAETAHTGETAVEEASGLPWVSDLRFPTPCHGYLYAVEDAEGPTLADKPHTLSSLTLDERGHPEEKSYFAVEEGAPAGEGQLVHQVVIESDDLGRITFYKVASYNPVGDLEENNEWTLTYEDDNPTPLAGSNLFQYLPAVLSRNIEILADQEDGLFTDLTWSISENDGPARSQHSRSWTMDENDRLSEFIRLDGVDMWQEFVTRDEDGDMSGYVRVFSRTDSTYETRTELVYDWNGSLVTVEHGEDSTQDAGTFVMDITMASDRILKVDEGIIDEVFEPVADVDGQPGYMRAVLVNNNFAGESYLYQGARPTLGTGTREGFQPPWYTMRFGRDVPQTNLGGFPAGSPHIGVVPDPDARLVAERTFDFAMGIHRDERRLRYDSAGNVSQVWEYDDVGDLTSVMHFDYSCYADFVDEMPERSGDLAVDLPE